MGKRSSDPIPPWDEKRPCTDCGADAALFSEYCHMCLARQAAARTAARQNSPHYDVRAARATRLAAGLCVTCGEPTGSQRSRCSVCAARFNADTKRRQARRRAVGLCIVCGMVEDGQHVGYCDPCYERSNRRNTQRRQDLKDAAFAAYGGARCACCGETERAFLQIDHVRNDGSAHRKEIGRSQLYFWLKKQAYPEGFQVLCANCNIGKRLNGGVCPHKTEPVLLAP